MNFVRRNPFLGLALLAMTLLVGVPDTGSLHAQQAQQPVGLDVQEAQQALQLFNQGKYAEAAAIYEGIPRKYPTSALNPEASFRLGYIYYIGGQHDKAVAALEKNTKGRNIPPELLELSFSLVPQVLAAKAAKGDPSELARKGAFEAAIREFDTFLQNFPQSEEVENANYGKARAHFQIGQYEQAAGALRANMQRFPQSPSALDTQFMLAVVLGTQATTVLQKATARDLRADAAYDEAMRLLGEIIQKRTDIALSNDAQFQLGEILAARGSFAKGAQQQQLLKRALGAYRAVLPKEQVVKAQQDRLAAILGAIQQAGAARDVAALRRAQRLQQREQEKAALLEQRVDQTLLAKLKSGQVYLTLERFDEARVVLRFVDQFVQDAEQKKQILYFIVVTYAGQNLAEKAVEQYDKFMAAHPGDPLGENLPTVVGQAFLGKNNPQKAIEYFKAQVTLFPKSRFAADAVMRQALALIPLERFDEALEVLRKFLASSPTKEQAAAAELGLATIYQKTNKTDEAIKAFKAVRDKYSGTPEAEQASFFVAQMTLGSGDPKTAAEEFSSFVKNFPQSELAPPAMLLLGQAQAEAGQKEAALKTYKELVEKYPKSEQVPASYFQRAALRQQEGDLPGVQTVMREFIATHPESDRLFSAYDYMAQVDLSGKKPLEAIAVYEEFAAQRPEDPHAPTALLRIAAQWKKYGESQGPYLTLTEEQRKEWRKGIETSRAVSEKVLEKYPEGPAVALALQNLLGCQKLQVRAKLKTEANIEEYFQGVAQKFEAKPATKNKVLFTLASYIYEKDKAKAAELMKSAYDPQLVYAPADLDLYGSVLIEQKKYDEAQTVYNKVAKDNPLPPNTAPDKAGRSIAEPQSIALFGTAKILQMTGKTAEAAKRFEELKKTYPWSLKLLEADFGIAEGLFEQKEYDDALKLLGPVAKATHASTNLRARAMLLIGKVAEQRGEFEAAINNYIKIGAFFASESDLAAEGLWRGGQLLEKQANGQIPMPKVQTVAAKAPRKKRAP